MGSICKPKFLLKKIKTDHLICFTGAPLTPPLFLHKHVAHSKNGIRGIHF